MIVSSHSSVPVDVRLPRQEQESLVSGVRLGCGSESFQIADGVKARAKALVITDGVNPGTANAKPSAASINWAALDTLKQGGPSGARAREGRETPADVRPRRWRAVHGASSSRTTAASSPAKDALILELPKIVDAVAGKVRFLSTAASAVAPM
jgi:hypothetical protein